MAGEAARAHREFSARRHQWGVDLYTYDRDDVDPRRVYLEAPGGNAVSVMEYKHLSEGEIDLNDLQFKSLRATTRSRVPLFLVQFTCPPDHPSWAFKLHGINDPAHESMPDGGPVIYSEFALVEFVRGLRGQRSTLLPVELDFVVVGRSNRYPGRCPLCLGQVKAGTGDLIRSTETGQQTPAHHGCIQVRRTIGADQHLTGTASEEDLLGGVRGDRAAVPVPNFDRWLPDDVLFPVVTQMRAFKDDDLFVPYVAAARATTSDMLDAGLAAMSSSRSVAEVVGLAPTALLERPTIGALRRGRAIAPDVTPGELMDGFNLDGARDPWRDRYEGRGYRTPEEVARIRRAIDLSSTPLDQWPPDER